MREPCWWGWCAAVEHGATGRNWNTGSSILTQGRNRLLSEWWSTATGCSDRLWSLLLWMPTCATYYREQRYFFSWLWKILILLSSEIMVCTSIYNAYTYIKCKHMRTLYICTLYVYIYPFLPSHFLLFSQPKRSQWEDGRFPSQMLFPWLFFVF